MMGKGGRRSPILLLVVGLLLGAGLLIALRLVAQPEEHAVHYHANWAVFVNGERLDLRANRYMEDVTQCTADPSQLRPQDRVHMHMGNQDVVHVHAAGAAWGHLLANLGFGVGDTYLDLDSERLESGEAGTLKFVVNGNPVRSIRNLPVGDSDRLLISYGPETVDEVVASQFPQVAETAAYYNTMPDPASCSGQQEATFGERLRRAVGI